MTKAIVLIPTFDHGETLRPAIHAALNQTVKDLEIVVIGDGAPASTATLMDEICENELRVSYRAFPKSPRTGEPHRHEVLRSADAEFVLYLSDDDIWMPDHAELLIAALDQHDLAVSLSTALLADEMLSVSGIDLGDPTGRAIELSGSSRVSLTEMAHRLDSYHRLPYGWRTTPAGHYTDHWMYQQWLGESWVRATTVPVWTQLHFPTSVYGMLSTNERAAQQWKWWAQFGAPGWTSRRQEIVVRALLRQSAGVEQYWTTMSEREPDESGARRERDAAASLAREDGLRADHLAGIAEIERLLRQTQHLEAQAQDLNLNPPIG